MKDQQVKTSKAGPTQPTLTMKSNSLTKRKKHSMWNYSGNCTQDKCDILNNNNVMKETYLSNSNLFDCIIRTHLIECLESYFYKHELVIFFLETLNRENKIIFLKIKHVVFLTLQMTQYLPTWGGCWLSQRPNSHSPYQCLLLGDAGPPWLTTSQKPSPLGDHSTGEQHVHIERNDHLVLTGLSTLEEEGNLFQVPSNEINFEIRGTLHDLNCNSQHIDRVWSNVNQCAKLPCHTWYRSSFFMHFRL